MPGWLVLGLVLCAGVHGLSGTSNRQERVTRGHRWYCSRCFVEVAVQVNWEWQTCEVLDVHVKLVIGRVGSFQDLKIVREIGNVEVCQLSSHQ